MLKHTYTLSVKNDAGAAVLADTIIYTADAEENFSDSVAAGGVNEIDLTITKAALVSFYVESDQDVTMNVNVDDNSVQQVLLKAKKAWFWNTDQPGANPITPASVTKLFFHNAGLLVANFKGGFLVNA